MKSVADINPRLRRIVLDGTDLPDYPRDRPAQWLKLFFEPDGPGRALTIRAQSPGSRDLTIDFVSHGHGLAGNWAARAEPGLALWASRSRSGFQHQPGRRVYLLGDESALPAISSIVEALPAGAEAQALVEIESPAAEQDIASAAAVTWGWVAAVAGQPGAALAARARDLGIEPMRSQVWIAAESGAVAEMRRHFRSLGFDKSGLTASGYWKLGEADHKDRSGDE